MLGINCHFSNNKCADTCILPDVEQFSLRRMLSKSIFQQHAVLQSITPSVWNTSSILTILLHNNYHTKSFSNELIGRTGWLRIEQAPVIQLLKIKLFYIFLFYWSLKPLL